MLIKTTNKKDAYIALINTLLKDNTMYCNNCGMTYRASIGEPCCENPEIGTNADVLRAVVLQVREIKDTRGNDFAANKSKTMRWGLQLPPFIYKALKDYEEKHNRKFLKDNNEIVWFARNFPQFAIPKTL